MLSSITRLDLTAILSSLALGLVTLPSTSGLAQAPESDPVGSVDSDASDPDAAAGDGEPGFWDWLERNLEPAAGDGTTPGDTRRDRDRDRRGGGHGGGGGGGHGG